MNRIVKRLAIPLGAAAIIGTSGFAFMASNTVSPSYAGEGLSTVSGYTVTGISLQQDKGDLTYVNFDAQPNGVPNADSDPANAQITFDNTNFYNCTRTTLNRANNPEAHFVCDLRTDGVAVQPITGMNVIVTH